MLKLTEESADDSNIISSGSVNLTWDYKTRVQQNCCW